MRTWGSIKTGQDQYASHIDNLKALGQAVESIAEKHVSAKVPLESYPMIGECLLTAIKDAPGEAATPEVVSAWHEAYDALAKVFIEREREIYEERNAALFPVKEAR